MCHVMIVGGSKGLGRELAVRLSQRGVVVSVLSRTPPWEAPANIHYFPADLGCQTSARSACEQALKSHGELDSILFCQRFRGEGDGWEGELSVGLGATKDLIDYSANFFSASGSRSIVIVGSVAGPWIASDQPAGYHVAKAGLDALIRYYAVKLGPMGIRVNGVSPSAFIKAESRRYHSENPAASARMAALTPLRRMGTAEDSADAVEFLAGKSAGFITGQNLIVDGGLTLQLQTSIGTP
jgi:hypothetical protein